MHDDTLPLDTDELMNMADRLLQLPAEDEKWVERLFHECIRARMHEAELLTAQQTTRQGGSDENVVEIVLDAAEWLKTLWNVGYMGTSALPSMPRSAFPVIEAEDVMNSALFSRIRQGKRPLPFPPPTQNGSPWHELLDVQESEYDVSAEVVRDGEGRAIGLIIEGCVGWHIIEEVTEDKEYITQHQGKGPLFRLRLNPLVALLRREPPRWARRILMQERGGFRSFTLEWPSPAGRDESYLIPLRALSWDRAESEANYWIATKYPEMYGQVEFERVE